MRRRGRAWHQRVAGALACAGAGLLAAGGLWSTAYAAGPQRVGWWNAASTPGVSVVAPSPSTPAGGIRVAAGPGQTAADPVLPSQVPRSPQILAYGAVLYALPEGASATLHLKIAGTPEGTPQLAACPTSATTWTAGDDQPSGAEPAYDCTTQRYAGTVSADLTSITFKVKAFLEPTPGLLSLAIVPDVGDAALPTGGNAPFAVDLNPPDATSLTLQSTETPTPGAAAPLPSETPSPTTAFIPPNSSGSTGFGAPLGLPVALPPSPPAAPGAAATPSSAAAPAAAASPAVPPQPGGEQTSARARIASALGTTALIAAILVWALGYGLLGGRIIPLSVPLRRG